MPTFSQTWTPSPFNVTVTSQELDKEVLQDALHQAANHTSALAEAAMDASKRLQTLPPVYRVTQTFFVSSTSFDVKWGGTYE